MTPCWPFPGQQQQLRAFASAFGHPDGRFLDPRTCPPLPGLPSADWRFMAGAFHSAVAAVDFSRRFPVAGAGPPYHPLPSVVPGAGFGAASTAFPSATSTMVNPALPPSETVTTATASSSSANSSSSTHVNHHSSPPPAASGSASISSSLKGEGSSSTPLKIDGPSSASSSTSSSASSTSSSSAFTPFSGLLPMASGYAIAYPFPPPGHAFYQRQLSNGNFAPGSSTGPQPHSSEDSSDIWRPWSFLSWFWLFLFTLWPPIFEKS